MRRNHHALAALAILLIQVTSLSESIASTGEWYGSVDDDLIAVRGSTNGGSAGTVIDPPGTGLEEPGTPTILSTPPLKDPYEYYAYFGCPFEGRPRSDDSCSLNPPCVMPDGSEGITHEIFRRLPEESWELTKMRQCAKPGSVSAEEAASLAAPDPEVSQEDFRKLPFTPASIHIQPGPDTLKNYHTNIYAEAGEQLLAAEMLGREVQIRATPVSYIYDYGDGTVTGPVEDPGQALPADVWDIKTNTSHQYRDTGDYTVQITTVFTGEYKVEDGPWQRIDGTAEVASDPQTLTVWRTKSGWVDRPCGDHRTAWGC